ncbi:MAG: TrkA family potassium uptake protein [Thermotogae bacterium]|nr:TrkA family potassium uptake protein [Thermotogota bacterium]
MAKTGYFVVIGCGRLGSRVAGYLSEQGHSVVVIDAREETFERLPAEFTGFTIHGDASEIETLKQAKMERADVVMALTSDDNTNFMLAQIARKMFGVTRVISYVHNPENMELFKDFSIEAFCPVLLAFETLKGLLEEMKS